MRGGRYKFTGDDLDMPLLFSGGFHNFNLSVRLEDHCHPQGPEITYVMKGTTSWLIPGQPSLRLSGGSLAIIQPDLIHRGEGHIISPCWLFWLVLDLRNSPEENRHNTPFDTEEIKYLQNTFREAGNRVCFAGKVLDSDFRELYKLLRKPDKSPLYKVKMRLVVCRIIAASGECLRESGSGSGISIAETAREFMRKNLRRNIGVSEIAEHCGLSQSQFSRRFKQETGVTPADCIQRFRVERGGQLLRTTSKSITAIAFELGFSSSQYFAAVFRKYTGITPKYYRKFRA